MLAGPVLLLSSHTFHRPNDTHLTQQLEKETATAAGRARVQIDEGVGKMVKAAAEAAARGATPLEVEAAARAAEEEDDSAGGGGSGAAAAAAAAGAAAGPTIEMDISLCPVDVVDKFGEIEGGVGVAALGRGGEGGGGEGGGGGGGGQGDADSRGNSTEGTKGDKAQGVRSAGKDSDGKAAASGMLIEEVA